MIGKKSLIVGMLSQHMMQLGRAAIIISPRIVSIETLQNMFGVPTVVLPFVVRRGMASCGIPILVRPIYIADIIVNDHIVNQIRDVQIFTQQLVFFFHSSFGIGNGKHGSVIGIAAGHKSIRIVFNDIVILGRATAVGGGKMFIRAFVQPVQAPIQTIELEMNLPAMRRKPAHFQL